MVAVRTAILAEADRQHRNRAVSSKCVKEQGDWLEKEVYLLLNGKGFGRTKEGFIKG